MLDIWALTSFLGRWDFLQRRPEAKVTSLYNCFRWDKWFSLTLWKVAQSFQIPGVHALRRPWTLISSVTSLSREAHVCSLWTSKRVTHMSHFSFQQTHMLSHQLCTLIKLQKLAMNANKLLFKENETFWDSSQWPSTKTYYSQLLNIEPSNGIINTIRMIITLLGWHQILLSLRELFI